MQSALGYPPACIIGQILADNWSVVGLSTGYKFFQEPGYG